MNRAAWICASVSLLAACGQRPAPRSAPPPADTCASVSAPGVSAATTEALARASNALEYEDLWRTNHPGETTGTVNSAEVMATLRAHGSEIQQCFFDTLRGTTESARVAVRFVLDASGRVGNVSLGAGEVSSPEFGCCVVKRVAKWSFPKPEAGFVVVEYPFSLRASP
ncbi:MAG: AgmX/PglI C-terminal domain-containing protein [Polyangiales bacterium]